MLHAALEADPLQFIFNANYLNPITESAVFVLDHIYFIRCLKFIKKWVYTRVVPLSFNVCAAPFVAPHKNCFHLMFYSTKNAHLFRCEHKNRKIWNERPNQNISKVVTVIMPVMIIALNPVNLNSIYVDPLGIIPRCHLNTEIRPQTIAESFQWERVEGLLSPPMGSQQNLSAGDE